MDFIDTINMLLYGWECHGWTVTDTGSSKREARFRLTHSDGGIFDLEAIETSDGFQVTYSER